LPNPTQGCHTSCSMQLSSTALATLYFISTVNATSWKCSNLKQRGIYLMTWEGCVWWAWE